MPHVQNFKMFFFCSVFYQTCSLPCLLHLREICCMNFKQCYGVRVCFIWGKKNQHFECSLCELVLSVLLIFDLSVEGNIAETWTIIYTFILFRTQPSNFLIWNIFLHLCWFWPAYTVFTHPVSDISSHTHWFFTPASVKVNAVSMFCFSPMQHCFL